jgi:hypothetical protein
MTTAFGLQPVIWNATTIAGIRSARYDPRLSHQPEASSGSLQQTAHHFAAAAPMVAISGTDLKAWADVLKANADAPYAAFTGAGLTWYEALLNTAAPGYASASSHRKHVAALGGLVANRIGWAPGELATIDLSAFLLSADGSAATYVTTTNNALLTQPAWIGGYRLTSLTFGGASVTIGCQGLDLEFSGIAENNVPASCRSLGLPYPTQLALGGPHGPVVVGGRLRLQTLGIAPSSGDLVAVFSEVDNAGFLKSGGSTVTATLNAELEPLRPVGGETGRPLAVEFAIHGRFDGTNKPVTIATT